MKSLIAWWQSLPLPWRNWRIVGQVLAGDEVSERLPHRGIVLVGPLENATWAVMNCPCRTGHRLMVNLDKTRRPFWKIESRNPLSIHPSIDNVTPERRCHFTIRADKTIWAITTSKE